MTAKSTHAAVTVRECAWGSDYAGSRAALLRAELGIHLRFPGDVGNRRTMQTYRDGDRKVWIRRTGSDLYRVSVYYTAPENRARRAAKQYRCRMHAGQVENAREIDVAFQSFMRKVIDGAKE